MERQVLISLHDVTPFHMKRMKYAEELFVQWGIAKVSYLFIPDYHNRSDTLTPSEVKDYRNWIHNNRNFQVQWMLHGYSHLELSTLSETKLSPAAACKRKLLTAGEAEFLSLDRQATMEKIKKGQAVFESHMNTRPKGFIAPAWLFNKYLVACLKELGFLFTEDHKKIYLLDQNRQLTVPVITWATRTFIRKYSSILFCPLLGRIWSNRKVIRIAMHPFDFDHPETVANIGNIIRRVVKYRKQLFYDNIAA